jgi:hypothetical protein
VAASRQISAPDAQVAVTLEVTLIILVAGNFLELRPVFVESLDRSAAARLRVDTLERLAGDKNADRLFARTHVEKHALIDVLEAMRTRRRTEWHAALDLSQQCDAAGGA